LAISNQPVCASGLGIAAVLNGNVVNKYWRSGLENLVLSDLLYIYMHTHTQVYYAW
jgi:hypothetical protein